MSKNEDDKSAKLTCAGELKFILRFHCKLLSSQASKHKAEFLKKKNK